MQERIDPSCIHISIITPCYNSASTIVETIQSVKQQTYGGWELILVDDGSSDATVSLMNSLAEQDERIRMISQPNQGACAARNTGIEKANYDWLLFLDSDDWIDPRYLEKMVSVLASDPQIDVVHCKWTRVSPEGKMVRERFGPPLQDLFPVLAMQCPFSIHACIVRKSLVEAAGGFDTSLIICEDWDLWQRIARIGARFELVSEVLAFYRMRRNSLSSDGIQFFNDAIRVLTQGHSPDQRLKDVALRHPEGEPIELLSGRRLCLASWLAGYMIGCGQDARPLLSALSGDREPALDAYAVADSIFEAAVIPAYKALSDWYLLYAGFEPGINDFLSALEAHSQSKGLAKKSKLILERLILQNTKLDTAIALGHFYAVSLEITEPLKDIVLENRAIERLYFLLKMENKHLGALELPVCDGLVSAYVLKDAIAAQFYWKILGQYFQNSIYNKPGYQAQYANRSFEEIHNEIGWTTFMQQIWNRPAWDSAKFYDATIKEEAASTLDANRVKIIEISQELPDIMTNEEHFNVVYAIGGIEAGTITIPVSHKLIRAAQIRSAINISSGLELCRICVREALLGRSLIDSASIVQRLTESAQIKNTLLDSLQENNALVLGRRKGPINSSTSRRAKLPAAAATQLFELANAVQEPVMKIPGNLDQTEHVFYAPELITAISGTEWKNKSNQKRKQGNVYGRQHFETLFSKQADPWKYTHPYEQTKYEFTLSLLPQKTIPKALEIACAEGHFTEQLAPLVQDLVAADISKVALERAAGRCQSFDHIRFQYLDLVEEELPGQFDLIVCSEVLYFVGDRSKLKLIAQKFADALIPGGHLAMAHAHQVIDEPDKPGFDWGLPFGAKTIGDVFSQINTLQLVREIHTPLYRVQLFQKTRPKIFSWLQRNKPDIQYLDQPTSIPEAVKDTVRWNGGKPSASTVITNVSTNRLPILMYHRVAPGGSANLSRYRVTPTVFEEQLKYLKDSGYYSVSLNEWTTAIVMQRPLPGLAIALTFDDAYMDFYEYAFPLLQKYGFSATVFLVSDHIGKQNTWDEAYGENVPLMGWQEIIELKQQGIEFGSHSATHHPLTSLSQTGIVSEGARSRKDLQNALQKPVDVIAYPYGDTDPVVAHLLGACGYTIGVTCRNTLSTFQDNPMMLPRIEVEGSYKLKEFIARLS